MSGRLQRFTAGERVTHWLVALSFVYVALTGLSLWSHRIYWLSDVLGGGVAVRRWHPWVGVAFAVTLGVMFLRWAKAMRLSPEDRSWLRKAHRYAVHDDSDLPEPGKFNGGQKALFWLQSVACVVLLASGLALWIPAEFPRTLVLWAVLIHPVAALLSMAGIIVHIYMGTLGVPGALTSMVRGWVTSAWARAHHPKWHREISRR